MENAKEEIRARLAVEDVISQYIELKRAGRTLKGHSPWGTDRTPSFMVSPEKGIWHDFSSNKGGDIFTFVMEMEGIGFREALEKLARQAGVELKRYDGGDREFARRKQRCFDILELTAKFYQHCLSKSPATQRYVFYKRNLNKGIVEKFRIGYAPPSGTLLVRFLAKRGFSEAEMEEAGLLNRRKTDLFRARMMVPLMDEGGKVIGFTGRKLDEKDENSPKYLNTPETILYNKGRHIFGFSQARAEIRKTDFIVVVEGNMDVISSHQAGVCQAVATAGTAMTEMHLKSFARAAKDVRLAYDSDEAGVRAAERAIEMASKTGLYLSVIDDYHGCKDADELIQKDPLLWREAVQKYRPAIEWLFEQYEKRYDLRTEKGFQEYCDATKRAIARIDAEDTVLREKYERTAAEHLGVSLTAFRSSKPVETEKPRWRKPFVVKNTTGGGDVVKNTTASIAEKHLGALVVVGGEKSAFFQKKDFKNCEKGELELIFEEKYAKRTAEERAGDRKLLEARLLKERGRAKKMALDEALKVAEAEGDEQKAGEVLAELNKLIKKQK